MRPYEVGAIAAGAAYLVALGWAMQNLSYDIWGAMVVVPILSLVSAPLISRAFAGDLAPLRPWVWVGLAAKFAGAIIGYNVRFDVYGGSADAGAYHAAGKLIAGDFWDGKVTLFGLLPTQTGTQFVDQLTGLVYTIGGSSRLGGFMVFTWFSFWGLVFFIKAAHHAIDGLATHRYLIFIFLFPSLVYWGSSTGKEAVVGFFLGLSTFGAALVLARRGRAKRGVVLIAVGLAGAAFVRPHFAAIWAGAIAIALVGRVVLDAIGRSNRESDERRRVQLGSIVLVVVAGIGFAIIASVTLNYLDFADETDTTVTDQVGAIFEEVEDRTTQGGSSFQPVSVTGPWDYPNAALRTITRPLLTEANSTGELLPAVEMTALLFIGIFSWRRFANIPKLMLSTPYVVFAVLCVFTFGVAFSSIGNLGILVRQRSLILPLVLLFWCLPPIVFASERAHAAKREAAADARAVRSR